MNGSDVIGASAFLPSSGCLITHLPLPVCALTLPGTVAKATRRAHLHPDPKQPSANDGCQVQDKKLLVPASQRGTLRGARSIVSQSSLLCGHSRYSA